MADRKRDHVERKTYDKARTTDDSSRNRQHQSRLPDGRAKRSSSESKDKSYEVNGGDNSKKKTSSRTEGRGESENHAREDKRSKERVSTSTRERSRRSDGTEVKRTKEQEMARLGALYLVPVLLVIPISLLLTLTKILLTPLYNSIPLALHTKLLFGTYTIFISVIYWHCTSRRSGREAISARVCLSLAALGGDLVSISGRKVGSRLGRLLGGRLGAVFSLGVLGISIVGGASAFALLCFDHMSPIKPTSSIPHRISNLVNIMARTTFYITHIWYGQKLWSYLLSGSSSALVQRPEKTMLFISVILTAFTFFLRPALSTSSFSRKLHESISKRFKLDRKAQKSLYELTSRLPNQVFPILIIMRLPLLVLALREQIFLHPKPPYLAAGNALRVLSSEKSLTGQVVVAESLQNGYRFLRCDHSLLGGRWIREVAVGGKTRNATRTEMGDSIFSTFTLQEIGMLAHRSDASDSLMRTIALTTEMEVRPESETEGQEANPAEERALIIGLGVGIAASAFARRGYQVDVVEIDPAVYKAASDHFGLSARPMSTVNLVSGSDYVHQLAEMRRLGDYNGTQWSFAIQDCFSGGSVPGELFTKEFWQDLSELVSKDGIVTMNFVGLLGSKASKAVLVTLLSVFEQCRAFEDDANPDRNSKEATNMVVMCTMAHSPLLTFRRPVAADVMRSPLSTVLSNEIQFDSILTNDDLADPMMMLHRGNSDLDKWQVESALAMWKAMQQLLTPDVWMTW